MGAGRRYKAPGSETKNFITHNPSSGTRFLFVPGLHATQVPRGEAGCPRYVMHMVLVSQLRNLEFSKIQIYFFSLYNRLQENLSRLGPGGRHYL